MPPRYHPACRVPGWTHDRSLSAVTGQPVRFYWGGADLRRNPFFRRLTGDGRITACWSDSSLGPSVIATEMVTECWVGRHNHRVSDRRGDGQLAATMPGQPSYGADPLSAIKCGFRNYSVFHGRAGRSEFWWWTLFSVAGLIVCGLGVMIIGLATSDQDGNSTSRLLFIPLVVGGLFFLSTIVPTIAVTIRRLHDTGNSGYLYLLNLIPYIGGIIVLILCIARSSSQGVRFDRP